MTKYIWLVPACMVATACGAKTTIQTQGTNSTPATSNATASETKTAAAKPAKPKRAHLGSTITVKGMSDGEKMAVTLLDAQRWAGSQFDSPSAGTYFEAVRIKLHNVGSAIYSDSPTNGIKGVTNKDEPVQTTISEKSPNFGGSAKIAPGDSQTAWVTLEVPKGSKVSKLQFTMDSGFADDTGEWVVK